MGLFRPVGRGRHERCYEAAWYALAMHSLRIPPALDGERWPWGEALDVTRQFPGPLRAWKAANAKSLARDAPREPDGHRGIR